MKLLTATAVASLLLAGCSAPMVRLTVHSIPEGAAIIQGNQVLGTTPTVLSYPAAVFKSGQCITLRPLTARWASGADESWPGRLCPSVGYNQQYTFMRPANAPGAALDAQVAAANAYQAAAVAAARAQQDAQQDQMLYQAAGTLGNTLGCAAAGGCLPPPPVAHYPAAPPASYQPTVQPFSNPPVTCTLGPTGTTATCH